MLILTEGELQPALDTRFHFYPRYDDMNMPPPLEEIDTRRLCLMGSDALIWIQDPLTYEDYLPLISLIEFLDYMPLHGFALACTPPVRGVVNFSRWFRGYIAVMQQEVDSEVFPLLTVTEKVLDHLSHFGTDLWSGLIIDQRTSPLKKPETPRGIFRLAAELEVPLYLRSSLLPGPEAEAYHKLITEFDEVPVVLMPDKVTPAVMELWGQNVNVWLTLADLHTSEMRKLPRDHRRVLYSSGFPKGLRLVDHVKGANYANLKMNTQTVTAEMEGVYALHRDFCADWFGEEIFLPAFREVFSGGLPGSDA